ncbi:hypothetical protein BRDID11002_28540 [Bradyrhizobium diazoefficiens]
MGLDPNNVTYDAIFNRMLEIFVQNITLANLFAAVGAGFFVATLLMRTMVPLRVANMVGCAFFAVFGALSANVSTSCSICCCFRSTLFACGRCSSWSRRRDMLPKATCRSSGSSRS